MAGPSWSELFLVVIKGKERTVQICELLFEEVLKLSDVPL